MQADIAPRPYGPFGLLVSLVAVAAAAAACFAVLGALLFLAAALAGGQQEASALAERLGRLDARALAQALPASQRAFFGVGCMLYLAGLGGLLAVARWRGGRAFGRLLAWDPAPIWPGARVAGLFLAACLAYHLVAGLTMRLLFPEFAAWLFVPRDPLAAALSFLMVVVLAPLVEELFFRGWIFTSLRARFAGRVAIAVSTVAFAFAHWDATGLYPVAVLLPGWTLGTIRERLGSSRPAFAAHALYNGVGWIVLFIAGLILR
ncbi:MAG TPA: type II CAAX endopeptidase family protein [Beijerinckiaceae bacterium]